MPYLYAINFLKAII